MLVLFAAPPDALVTGKKIEEQLAPLNSFVGGNLGLCRVFLGSVGPSICLSQTELLWRRSANAQVKHIQKLVARRDGVSYCIVHTFVSV